MEKREGKLTDAELRVLRLALCRLEEISCQVMEIQQLLEVTLDVKLDEIKLR